MSDCPVADLTRSIEHREDDKETTTTMTTTTTSTVTKPRQSGEATDSDVSRLFSGLGVCDNETESRVDEPRDGVDHPHKEGAAAAAIGEEVAAEDAKVGHDDIAPGAYVSPSRTTTTTSTTTEINKSKPKDVNTDNNSAKEFKKGEGTPERSSKEKKEEKANANKKRREDAAAAEKATFDFCRSALDGLPRLPAQSALDDSLSLTHVFHMDSVMERVFRDWRPPDSERQLRRQLVDRLATVVQHAFPRHQLQVHVFGSSVNGFEFVESDLDIMIAVQGQVNVKDAVRLLAGFLGHHRWRDIFEDVDFVSSCRVPIVRLKLKSHGFANVPSIPADISFGNWLAIRNSAMLRRYSLIDSRVIYLGYTVKLFAKINMAADARSGGLSSYAYLLLVIYFLQRCSPPVVPVLQQLEDPRHPVDRRHFRCDGFDSYFFDGNNDDLARVWPGYGANTRSRGQLFLDFLRFYLEEFDYENHIVSIRSQQPLRRVDKKWTRHYLAIQDPFDSTHNLGAVLTKETLVYIFKSWHKAFSAFSSFPFDSWPPAGSTRTNCNGNCNCNSESSRSISESSRSMSESSRSMSESSRSMSESSRSMSESSRLMSESSRSTSRSISESSSPASSSSPTSISSSSSSPPFLSADEIMKRYNTPAHYLLDPALYQECDKCGELGCAVVEVEEEEEEWPDLTATGKKAPRVKGCQGRRDEGMTAKQGVKGGEKVPNGAKQEQSTNGQAGDGRNPNNAAGEAMKMDQGSDTAVKQEQATTPTRPASTVMDRIHRLSQVRTPPGFQSLRPKIGSPPHSIPPLIGSPPHLIPPLPGSPPHLIPPLPLSVANSPILLPASHSSSLPLSAFSAPLMPLSPFPTASLAMAPKLPHPSLGGQVLQHLPSAPVGPPPNPPIGQASFPHPAASSQPLTAAFPHPAASSLPQTASLPHPVTLPLPFATNAATFHFPAGGHRLPFLVPMPTNVASIPRP